MGNSARVRLKGLIKRTALNGHFGSAAFFDSASARWRVRLDDGQQVSVKSHNLDFVEHVTIGEVAHAPSSTEAKESVGARVRESAAPCMVGWRCEAKFRAQSVGSSFARWYPGVIESVSNDGRKCDVLFDDGDRERHVPLRFLRGPTPATTPPQASSLPEMES